MIDLRVQEKKENKDIPRDSRFKVHIQLHSPCEDRKPTGDKRHHFSIFSRRCLYLTAIELPAFFTQNIFPTLSTERWFNFYSGYFKLPHLPRL